MYHQAWGGDRTLWSSWGVGELDQWATDQAKGEMRGLAQAELAAGPAGAVPIRAQRASRGAAHLDPVGREPGTGTAIQPLSGWGGVENRLAESSSTWAPGSCHVSHLFGKRYWSPLQASLLFAAW